MISKHSAFRTVAVMALSTVCVAISTSAHAGGDGLEERSDAFGIIGEAAGVAKEVEDELGLGNVDAEVDRI